MAKDAIGELGLDVTDFVKAMDVVNNRLEKLEGQLAKTDSKVKNGLVGGLKEAAKALGFTFGAAAVVRYIYNLRNLNTEIDDMRARLLEGSKAAKDFEEGSSGGAGSSAQRLGKQWDMFKIKAKVAVAETFQWLRKKGEDFGNSFGKNFLGQTQQTNEIPVENAADRASDEAKKQLLKDENDLVGVQAVSLQNQKDRLLLIKAELELNTKRMALIKSNPELFEDPRGMMHGLMISSGALKAEREAMQFQRDQELAGQKAISKEMEMQIRGQAGAAKLAQIRAKYAKEIAQAERDGKTDLILELQAQQRIAQAQIVVQEHNMTTRERLEQRRAARKFSRDSRKAGTRESDLEERLQRAELENHAITPGSELDRYRARRRGLADGGSGKKGGPQQQTKFENVMEQNVKEINNKLDGVFKNR